MKTPLKVLLCGSFCAITASAWAGVAYSVDGSMNTSSAAWSGTPAIALATPGQGNVYEGGNTGGGVVGIAFLTTSAFNLGEIKFESQGILGNNFSLSLYDLGTTVSETNPRYTIDNTSVDLFSADLNFSYTTAGGQITTLTFTGADQVSLLAGHWYSLEILNNDLASNLLVERASTALSAFMSLGTGATGARNNVPAGDRDPVAAIYAAPIPEPSSIALVGAGLMSLFMMRRSKNG
ncbi:MAG TPA: PEP-CTERM sorting domain-containing protein [Verrucomicrobiae bacterium]|nr:PEP-CTERM sorting domain-containing protein [Verrucomicrobiae bacterium]